MCGTQSWEYSFHSKHRLTTHDSPNQCSYHKKFSSYFRRSSFFELSAVRLKKKEMETERKMNEIPRARKFVCALLVE